MERRFPRRSSRATHLNPAVFKDVFCFFFGSPPTGGCGGGSGLSFPWETGGFVVIPARIRGGFRGRTWGNSSGGSDPGLTGLHTRAPVIVYRVPGIESQHALSGSPTAQESEVYPQAGPGAPSDSHPCESPGGRRRTLNWEPEEQQTTDKLPTVLTSMYWWVPTGRRRIRSAPG